VEEDIIQQPTNTNPHHPNKNGHTALSASVFSEAFLVGVRSLLQHPLPQLTIIRSAVDVGGVDT